MLPPLDHLHRADLLQDAVVEGHVQVEWNTVESLQTEDELVKQQLGLLVQGADEGVPLVEPQQHLHGPLQFGDPDVER